MRFPKLLIVLMACHFIPVQSNGQNNANTVDARWVISKSIEVMGGEPLLRSIKTLYSEMSTEMDGRAVIWVTKEMLPNKGAFQVVYNNRIVYEDWFNGKQGFEMVNGEKKEEDAASLGQKLARRNIFNELDYLDTSLYHIDLLNEEKVNNIMCYKIRAVLTGGFESHLFIDKTSFQTIKKERMMPGETQPKNPTYFSGFKKYGDLVYYTVFTMGDGADAQKATITKLLINESISDSDFNR